MPDPFRKEYRELNPAEKATVDAVKDKAAALHEELNVGGHVDQRCMALARTKLEECVFWAVKGITG